MFFRSLYRLEFLIPSARLLRMIVSFSKRPASQETRFSRSIVELELIVWCLVWLPPWIFFGVDSGVGLVCTLDLGGLITGRHLTESAAYVIDSKDALSGKGVPRTPRGSWENRIKDARISYHGEVVMKAALQQSSLLSFPTSSQSKLRWARSQFPLNRFARWGRMEGGWDQAFGWFFWMVLLTWKWLCFTKNGWALFSLSEISAGSSFKKDRACSSALVYVLWPAVGIHVHGCCVTQFGFTHPPLPETRPLAGSFGWSCWPGGGCASPKMGEHCFLCQRFLLEAV